MKDFSAPYGKAVYFPLSLQESADEFGKRDAWEVLQYALKWTLEQDVRSELLNDALDYLENMGGHKRAIKDFRNALNIEVQSERYLKMRDAMQRIRKSFGYA